MIFAFDVDGTITPSRGKMDTEFKSWFLDFVKNNRVILVTGSDRPKTIEQIGEDLFNSVEYCFNCAGNEVYHRGDLHYRNEWKPSKDLVDFLDHKLQTTTYTELYGNHIEVRTGLVNFSIVGRNATGNQRTRYYEWDKIHQERSSIALQIKSKFKELDAQVGGETGVDIFERGKDKSQILNYFNDEKIIFFGDRQDPEGNDYTLKMAIIENDRGSCNHVKDWKETWRLLNEDLSK